MSHNPFAFPPSLPRNPAVTIPWLFAASKALRMFVLLPLVVKPMKTSPGLPKASTWREKIWSNPKSLPAHVTAVVSSSAIAASARRFFWKRTTSSSARCIASAALPPLPATSALPRFSHARMSASPRRVISGSSARRAGRRFSRSSVVRCRIDFINRSLKLLLPGVLLGFAGFEWVVRQCDLRRARRVQLDLAALRDGISFQHRPQDVVHACEETPHVQPHERRRDVNKLLVVALVQAQHPARIRSAVVLQRDRALDHPLVERVLQAVRHVPDVFPHLVGLEELVLVEERDAVVVQLALELRRHGVRGNHGEGGCRGETCLALSRADRRATQVSPLRMLFLRPVRLVQVEVKVLYFLPVHLARAAVAEVELF